MRCGLLRTLHMLLIIKNKKEGIVCVWPEIREGNDFHILWFIYPQGFKAVYTLMTPNLFFLISSLFFFQLLINNNCLLDLHLAFFLALHTCHGQNLTSSSPSSILTPNFPSWQTVPKPEPLLSVSHSHWSSSSGKFSSYPHLLSTASFWHPC